jgi:2-hydroxy-3-keto-5-methylthiopentenyl-1-phosphate phosphatase
MKSVLLYRGPSAIRKPDVYKIDAVSNSDTIHTSENHNRIVKPEDKTLKDNFLFVYNSLNVMQGTAQNLFVISRLFGRGIDQITCRYDEHTQECNCLEQKAFVG